MIITIDVSGQVLRAVEVDNMRELAVHSASTAETTSSALVRSGLGEIARDGYAWLSIPALRAVCGPRAVPRSEEWDAGFDAMIAFASARGWVDVASDRVRSHVVFLHAERTPSEHE